jgi:hypothetical protein
MLKVILIALVACGCTAAQLTTAADKADQVKAGAVAVQAAAHGPVGQAVSAALPPAAPVITGTGEIAVEIALLAGALAAYFRQRAAEHKSAAATAKAERNSALDRLDSEARKAALAEAALTLAGNGRLVNR